MTSFERAVDGKIEKSEFALTVLKLKRTRIAPSASGDAVVRSDSPCPREHFGRGDGQVEGA